MQSTVGIGLAIAVISATVLNWAYVQEHGAASQLPPLSLRHPVRSLRLLVGSGPWLAGLAAEAMGFGLYVVALALAPLSLVQSVSAAGIGLLAYMSNRRSGHRASRQERAGVLVSVLGLAALGVSLAGGAGDTPDPALGPVLAWLAGCGALAAVTATVGREALGPGVAFAVAAGLLLATGDVATKVALEGGDRVFLLAASALGYGLGTSLLQIAYQHARALTAAGIAALLTNAVPIVAATTVLREGLPSGAMGVLRIVSFAAVVAGAVALARPATGRTATPAAAHEAERVAATP